MSFHFTPYSITFLLTSLIAAVSFVIIWTRRRAPGSTTFGLLMLAIAEWCLAAGLETGSSNPAVRIIFAKIEYIGITGTPFFLLIFTLQYTHKKKWLRPRWIALYALIPLLTTLMAFTNEWHGLIWSGVSAIDPRTNLTAYYHGPWFWVNLTSTHVYAFVSAILLIHYAIDVSIQYKKQILFLLIGFSFPLIASLIYVLDAFPVANLEVTPISFALSGLFLYWGLFRHQFLDMVPLARTAIVDILQEGVLVTDSQHRILDINPAAQALLHLPNDIVGNDASVVLEKWPQIIDLVYSSQKNGQEEILTQAQEPTCLHVRTSSLHHAANAPVGKLMIIQDITERYQAQREQVAHERTQAASQERQRIARQLHDSIVQSLHSAVLLLDNLKRQNKQGDSIDTGKMITLLERSIRQALREMRLAVYQWHPEQNKLGFYQHLETRLARVEKRAGLHVNVSLGTQPDLPSAWHDDLIALVTEALNNVIKHAYANSVQINLEQDNGRIRLTIRDDGRGFSLEKTKPGGMGLPIMRERAAGLEGRLQVTSSQGAGTQITLILPRKEPCHDD